MPPKNIVDTPPEGLILFLLDDGKDLFFNFLVVFLPGLQEALLEVFPLIGLPLLPKVGTHIYAG